MNNQAFEELLKSAGLSKKDFSKLVEMNYNSVTNWNKSDKIPQWVGSWLKLYAENHIDVAILDISIHGINGLNVAAKIREKDSETQILMISAYSDKDKLLQAVNLNLSGYMVKPITHTELAETLNKLISKVPQVTTLELTNNFNWNPNAKTLSYNSDNIKLTKNEVKIVHILLANKNKYMNSCEIQNRLFDENPNDNNCNNVVQLISRLKKKIFKLYTLDEYFIENCYGTGYKIIVN